MMKSQNSAIGRSHVVWLDVVRFVAMFTVVCCHSADPFNFYPGEPPANIDQIKFWGAAYGSFLRPCVPLFVMITGALLLPLKDDTSVFYKKRIMLHHLFRKVLCIVFSHACFCPDVHPIIIDRFTSDVSTG